MITTGLLGGFTTFSTAMVEALTARSEGKMVKFLMLWLVQVVGAGWWQLWRVLSCLCCCLVGIAPVFPPDVLVPDGAGCGGSHGVFACTAFSQFRPRVSHRAVFTLG